MSIDRHDFWSGIQRPDLHVRLDKNLYTDLAVAGTGIPVYEENGVPATPTFTGDLNGSWTRHNGVYISAASKGRIEVAGQNYDGRFGTGCVFLTPNWNGNDLVEHVISIIRPIDTGATSMVLVQKTVNSQLGIWVRGGGVLKFISIGVDHTTMPAYQPCMIGWSWEPNYISIHLNNGQFANKTTATTGDATVAVPKTYIGNAEATYNSPIDGITSDYCQWKDKARRNTDSAFWDAVYNRLKALHGREIA